MAQRAHVELHFDMAGAEALIASEVEKRMHQAVNLVRNAVLEKLSGPRSGRRYKVPGTQVYYTASAPGEAPAQRTGRLRQSISTQVEVADKEIVGAVGTDLEYGRYLEQGTAGMAARPWLEPAFRETKDDVKRTLGGQ